MEVPNKTYSVLIPDGEGDFVIFDNILNCVSQIKNIRLYVMSRKKVFPIGTFRYSKYVYRFFYLPETNNDVDWIAKINKITENYAIDVIMPIWEIGIKAILENKNLLQHPEKLVPLPSRHDFAVASSKALLADHLNRFDIPGPKTVPMSLNLLEDRESFMLRFPVLAKPLKSGGGKGIVKFKDYESLATYFKVNGLNEAYILQEYIKGEDYGCNLLCHNGEILAYTIQKGNLWDPAKPYSFQIGLDFIYNEKLYENVKKLMKSLNWSGIADLDLLYDEENDVFNIVEINPRFWGTLTAALLAGINYPHLLILMTMKEKIEPQVYQHIPYVNLRGLKILCKKNPAFIFKTRFIWNNSPLKYRLYDPIPFIYGYYLKTKDNIARKIQALLW